ncbi:hypothetical protein D3OALGA1CA_5707 [Olavius algarvensis associated proteobacterium Delta 3]|nr:hypothetical protein D3OALGB2SA_2469 [Olavius algarvensis associated proteobacterium Delta 3]CAB5170623.1 hypothetical protein D3OALGA1CA_5707 [Olavius algarvensis associated proteobacterium Delta 3]
MDRKQVSFRVDPSIVRKLKILAAKQDRTITELFIEAIQELLKKYNESGQE